MRPKSPRAGEPASSDRNRPVDRILARKNLRTGLIAGAISLILFGLSFFTGYIY